MMESEDFVFALQDTLVTNATLLITLAMQLDAPTETWSAPTKEDVFVLQDTMEQTAQDPLHHNASPLPFWSEQVLQAL